LNHDTAAIRTPHAFGKRNEGALLTISRNGQARQFRVGPYWLATLASLAVTFFAGHMAATAYLVFRDDLIGAVRQRDAARQLEYEDRIASLRANLDRVISRQLIDQQAIEARIAELTARQELLNGNGGALGKLLEEAGKRGIGDAARAAPDRDAALAAGNGGFGAFASAFSLRGSAGGGIDSIATASVATAADTGYTRMASSIAAIESRQKSALAALRDVALRRAETMAAAIAELAPETGGSAQAQVGGPYVALDPDAPFDVHAKALGASFERIDALRRRLGALPLGHPAPGQEMTSPFGARADPFLGTMAMHGGIDFRAAAGTAVPATAAGKVVEAGNSGGYGNLVEIAHGGGFSTRYGHLSEIRVKVGDEIAAGGIVGLSGSTGRSTGPHIHYEIRKDGAAVDPSRFLRAGSLLQNNQG
jgi:murein DD-endopeptidase MepM/ murein hydrolase activator NlpD